LSPARPNIFQYHDYVEFLKDWLAFRKAGQSRVSLRTLARQSGVASGYLPMVLARKRPLTHAALMKLMPHLGLNSNEQSFLEKLLVLGTSLSHEAKVASLESMQRFQSFQKDNAKDSEVFKYQAHWHYIVIREMATMPDFKLDPVWIQNQLRFAVTLHDIKEALSFLLEKGYIELRPDGSVHPPEKSLEASGETYRVALSQFHRDILHLAGQSIDKIPRNERTIVGHTCALSPEKYLQARQILENALQQIRDLVESETQAESVYHLEVALFPFTAQKRSAK
jgi:uncharacterized protein (TIGR02147 family)